MGREVLPLAELLCCQWAIGELGSGKMGHQRQMVAAQVLQSLSNRGQLRWAEAESMHSGIDFDPGPRRRTLMSAVPLDLCEIVQGWPQVIDQVNSTL